MPGDARFAQAVARFDAMHAEDPRSVEIDGIETPRSAHYHRRLGHWILSFEAEPSVPLRLAAACQHVRRWVIPRSEYPPGRRGYRRWRSALAAMHADIARGVLEDVGYESETVERVADLLRKVGLGRDPEVQRLEDAVCMVFLESELVPLAGKYDDEKVVDILRRTWAKMSEEGRRVASSLAAGLPERERALVEAASEE